MIFKVGPYRKSTGAENTHILPLYTFPPDADMEADVLDFIRRESNSSSSDHLKELLPLIQRVGERCIAAGPDYLDQAEGAEELSAITLRAISNISKN